MGATQSSAGFPMWDDVKIQCVLHHIAGNHLDERVKKRRPFRYAACGGRKKKSYYHTKALSYKLEPGAPRYLALITFAYASIVKADETGSHKNGVFARIFSVCAGNFFIRDSCFFFAVLSTVFRCRGLFWNLRQLFLTRK